MSAYHSVFIAVLSLHFKHSSNSNVRKMFMRTDFGDLKGNIEAIQITPTN